jgi:hypothetical protein
MTTAGPRAAHDMPDHGTRRDAGYDPTRHDDTLDVQHRVPVWPGPPPLPPQEARRRRIREILPELTGWTMIFFIMGGVTASLVVGSATVAVYQHHQHGAAVSKVAGSPARRGPGVTATATPSSPRDYLVPIATTSPVRTPRRSASVPAPDTSPHPRAHPSSRAPTTAPRSSAAATTGQPTTAPATSAPPTTAPPSTPAPTLTATATTAAPTPTGT